MVLVHRWGQTEHDFEHTPDVSFPIASLPEFIRLHETVASLVSPSRIVAIALNTSLVKDDDDARLAIDATAAETGLPVSDPVRFGAGELWAAIRSGTDALPWVAPG
jgi:uncharacterized NAD-dependent epimerase/dehydratase family protein